MTDLQRLTAQAIVNVFETGSPQGAYNSCIVVAGDRGHLTYGRSQTTLASGNLYKLVKAYCDQSSARYGAMLKPYLDRLRKCDLSLDNDWTLRKLLRQAGDDHVMQVTQDQFFDAVYWNPAVKAATGLGISLPLGIAIVYDSHIHGSWAKMRDRTNNAVGKPKAAGERTWLRKYVQTRRAWLKSCGGLLARTTYRMDTFEDLIYRCNWELRLPITAHGTTITESMLAPRVAGKFYDLYINTNKLASIEAENIDGTAYVEAARWGAKMGVEVGWEPARKRVIFGGKLFDVAPLLRNGHAWTPVRQTIESFGLQISKVTDDRIEIVSKQGA